MIWGHANLLVDIHYTEICKDSHKIAVKLGARKGHEERRPGKGPAESAFQRPARAEKSEISIQGRSNSSSAEGSRDHVESYARDRHVKGPDTGCFCFPTMFHETC